MEVAKIKMTDFITQDASTLGWEGKNLAAYQAWMQRLVHHKIYKKSQWITKVGDYFLDPDNNIMCWLCESLDIGPLLEDVPHNEVYVSDWNTLFVPQPLSENEESPKTMSVDFPYVTLGPNYLEPMEKKQRWKFKDQLKRFGARVEYIGPNHDDPQAKEILEFYDQRLKELNDTRGYKWIEPTIHFVPLLECNVKYFKIYRDEKWIGVSVLVEVEPNTYYAIIFNSHEPCVYAFVDCMAHTLTPGSKLHFGPAVSFDPKLTTAWRYKFGVSNSILQVPYLAVCNDGDVEPPYYSLTRNKWVL